MVGVHDLENISSLNEKHMASICSECSPLFSDYCISQLWWGIEIRGSIHYDISSYRHMWIWHDKAWVDIVLLINWSGLCALLLGMVGHNWQHYCEWNNGGWLVCSTFEFLLAHLYPPLFLSHTCISPKEGETTIQYNLCSLYCLVHWLLT